MIADLVLAASSLCVLGLGVVLGVRLGLALASRRTSQAEEERRLERARVVHDTRRISVARAGTRPGRVSRATIDMGASHMRQGPEET